MFHDDLAEDLARLDVLQANIGIDRGLHVAVTQKLPDEFVRARPPLKNQSTGGMAELVHRHPKARRLVDSLGDLAAERDFAFSAPALPREQPVLVPAPQ